MRFFAGLVLATLAAAPWAPPASAAPKAAPAGKPAPSLPATGEIPGRLPPPDRPMDDEPLTKGMAPAKPQPPSPAGQPAPSAPAKAPAAPTAAEALESAALAKETPGQITLAVTMVGEPSAFCRGRAQVDALEAPPAKDLHDHPLKKEGFGRVALWVKRDTASPCKMNSRAFTADVALERGAGAGRLRDGTYRVSVNGKPAFRLRVASGASRVETAPCAGGAGFVADAATHRCRKATPAECESQPTYEDLLTCRLAHREVTCDPRVCDPAR